MLIVIGKMGRSLYQADNPFGYFRDVLARVSTHPADKIDELLPGEWKNLNAKADADLDGDTAKIVKVT